MRLLAPGAIRGRSWAGRFEALAARLDRRAVTGRSGVEASFERLEVAVDACRAKRVSAEAQLQRMVLAVSHLTDGVILADEQGEIVLRNAKAEAYAGARHGDALVERSLVDLLARALAGESCIQPLELWGPPRRHLSLSAFPLHDGRQIVGALAVVEDVSEKRRLDAMRRDLVANIGHELKTPVGGISLLSDALEGATEVEEFRRLTTSMRREAVRLGRIIEDLLDLSRIEAQETHVSELVAVGAMIDEAVERVRTKAEHRQISLEVASVDAALRTLGDHRQLVSALDNLLENAVKYSDNGSSIRIAAVQEAAILTIAVSDHGIGIPTRELERIFERFYRVDRARARDTGGTGLGLSIARHIMQSHGGDVQVVSREGEGSTFTLCFPSILESSIPDREASAHG